MIPASGIETARLGEVKDGHGGGEGNWLSIPFF